ncbi:hypothetical protein [Fastidiosibacter lacustris]|uniref:hypothetical protein n=1 Tax=Fastidiosibacter lacustris TaxID=2056695 RepID=UPI000E34E7FB|nr:hypothetical protein [Fastidiosibacter lacustris]
MSFDLNNTIFYAVKKDGANNYEIKAVEKVGFYSDKYMKDQDKSKEHYLLSVNNLKKDKREKLFKKDKDNKFDLLEKTEWSEQELNEILGVNWNNNKIDFQQGADYNFAQLTNLSQVKTKDEAKALVEVLNTLLPQGSDGTKLPKFEFKKFKQDKKDNATIYTLKSGEDAYTITQKSDGITHIEASNNGKEFALCVLATAATLRANTRANLKAKVLEAVDKLDKNDPDFEKKKYEKVREILNIGLPKQQVNPPKEHPNSNSQNKLKQPNENKNLNKQIQQEIVPTVTLKLKPIYKKKDNNKDDDDLDWKQYEAIKEAYDKAGVRVRLDDTMFAKNQKGESAYSAEAQTKLQEIFKNNDYSEAFMNYYLGKQNTTSAENVGTL